MKITDTFLRSVVQETKHEHPDYDVYRELLEARRILRLISHSSVTPHALQCFVRAHLDHFDGGTGHLPRPEDSALTLAEIDDAFGREPTPGSLADHYLRKAKADT